MKLSTTIGAIGVTTVAILAAKFFTAQQDANPQPDTQKVAVAVPAETSPTRKPGAKPVETNPAEIAALISQLHLLQEKITALEQQTSTLVEQPVEDVPSPEQIHQADYQRLISAFESQPNGDADALQTESGLRQGVERYLVESAGKSALAVNAINCRTSRCMLELGSATEEDAFELLAHLPFDVVAQYMDDPNQPGAATLLISDWSPIDPALDS